MPHEQLAYVIRKTFWASLEILGSTVTNLTILPVFAGSEEAWACHKAFTLDGTHAIAADLIRTATTS